MKTVRAWLSSPRVQRLALHDLAVFVAAFVATGVLATGHLTVAALVAAATTAVKVALRQVLSVPPKDSDVAAVITALAATAVKVAPAVAPPVITNAAANAPPA